MNTISKPLRQQTTIDPGLQALLNRLEHQALSTDFRHQREEALSLVLRPYIESMYGPQLGPLPEEISLASLYLTSDYLPNDGHPTLVEQVRDLITEHVPEEERIWLDAVRHSYMDLLEITAIEQEFDSTSLALRSLGDGQIFRVKEDQLSPSLSKGHILLTRLIRQPDSVSLPGVIIRLSSTMGKALFTFTDNERREIEIGSGKFALGDWPEFAKQYGYLFIWNLARLRSGAMMIADSRIEYRNATGDPYLYAIGIYGHREPKIFADGLDQLHGFQRAPLSETTYQAPSSVTVWERRDSAVINNSSRSSVARVTLTDTQLFAETDSGEHLDALKHQLAQAFGFSLHFRGEHTSPPIHVIPEVDLLSNAFVAPPVIVSVEEDQKMLSAFLETVYLEWAEQPSPSLQDQTPRHFIAVGGDRSKVAALIDQMEQHDLAFHRTGKRGYDYNILRGHVGL